MTSGDDNVVRVPELGLTTQFMDDLRELINNDKYDHLSVAELVGAMDLVAFEYKSRWLNN